MISSTGIRCRPYHTTRTALQSNCAYRRVSPMGPKREYRGLAPPRWEGKFADRITKTKLCRRSSRHTARSACRRRQIFGDDPRRRGAKGRAEENDILHSSAKSRLEMPHATVCSQSRPEYGAPQ